MSLASYIYQGTQLFGRVYSVTLGNNDGQASVWGNEMPNQSPLRVRFEIEREADGAGKGKVALFNLNVHSRNAMQVGTQIVLRAGYKGSMAQHFAGKVDQVRTTRQGPDIITECDCTDGLNFTNFSVLNKSYAPGMQLYQVFADLAQAMLIDINNEQAVGESAQVTGIPNETLEKGLCVEGPVSRTLTLLCKKRNLRWSVVNRQLRIRPKSKYNSMPIVVLNRESGLVNVPAQNAGVVTFSCLLLPNVVPGALVQLTSDNQALNGYYLLGKTKTSADSHDSPWNIDVEGIPYTGSLQTLSFNQGSNFRAAVV